MADSDLVFGLHTAETTLLQEATRVQRAWVQDGRTDRRLHKVREQLLAAAIPVETVPRRTLDDLVPGARHQGVVLAVAPPPVRGEAELKHFLAALERPAFLLVLDGVQDPHNLGACLRSAEAAGIQAVILPRDRAAGLTPVARKVACGAAEFLPIFQVTNLARSLKQLRDAGIWLYGAAGEAEHSVYETDLTGPVALVMGSEGKGLRRLTREHCDGLLRIPMAGQVESLNVSVATGVVLFEALRQRDGGRVQ